MRTRWYLKYRQGRDAARAGIVGARRLSHEDPRGWAAVAFADGPAVSTDHVEVRFWDIVATLADHTFLWPDRVFGEV